MASIENRSRFIVTVQNRPDLTQSFAYTRERELKVYIASLKANGYKPKLARTNDSFAIRIRGVGRRTQCLYASTEQEAIDIRQRVELERRNGLFVDYAKGRSVSFADLMVRYLREESPRHKGFEVEGYILNAILADAGLERVDIAQAYAEHKNPQHLIQSALRPGAQLVKFGLGWFICGSLGLALLHSRLVRNRRDIAYRFVGGVSHQAMLEPSVKDVGVPVDPVANFLGGGQRAIVHPVLDGARKLPARRRCRAWSVV